MSQVLKFCSRLFPVEAGQTITIYGKAASCGENFEIDLSDDNSLCLGNIDINLHLSFIFGNENVEGVVERNSHSKGEGWDGKEVNENLIRCSPANPIQRGDDFKVAIYIDTCDFIVSINDRPFCSFPKRKQLTEIHWLGVWRDVEKIYRVDQVTSSPKCWPLANQKVYTGLIPGHLRAGSVIVVAATPRGCGDFIFNFIQTETGRNLFHFRPQLSNSSIVMNDQCENLQWRWEENLNLCPIKSNRKFKLAIALTDNCFLIAVDGQRIATLEFREENSNLFQWIGGLEIVSSGLELDIEAVNFMRIAPECDQFEVFSKQKSSSC